MRENPLPDWVHHRNRERVKSLRIKAYLAQIALGATLIYWMVEGAWLLAYKGGLNIPAEVFDIVISAESLYTVLLLATTILFVIWSYGAHSNLKLFDRRGIRHADQAAIWWWLVPFASFYVPFRVVHETARGSVAQNDELHWNDLDSPSIARWWTGLLLTGLISSQIGGLMIEAADRVAGVNTAINVLLVGSLLMVAAAATAIGLIQLVTIGQVGLANELWPDESRFPLTSAPPASHGSSQPPSPTG